MYEEFNIGGQSFTGSTIGDCLTTSVCDDTFDNLTVSGSYAFNCINDNNICNLYLQNIPTKITTNNNRIFKLEFEQISGTTINYKDSNARYSFAEYYLVPPGTDIPNEYNLNPTNIETDNNFFVNTSNKRNDYLNFFQANGIIDITAGIIDTPITAGSYNKFFDIPFVHIHFDQNKNVDYSKSFIWDILKLNNNPILNTEISESFDVSTHSINPRIYNSISGLDLTTNVENLYWVKIPINTNIINSYYFNDIISYNNLVSCELRIDDTDGVENLNNITKSHNMFTEDCKPNIFKIGNNIIVRTPLNIDSKPLKYMGNTRRMQTDNAPGCTSTDNENLDYNDGTGGSCSPTTHICSHGTNAADTDHWKQGQMVTCARGMRTDNTTQVGNPGDAGYVAATGTPDQATSLCKKYAKYRMNDKEYSPCFFDHAKDHSIHGISAKADLTGMCYSNANEECILFDENRKTLDNFVACCDSAINEEDSQGNDISFPGSDTDWIMNKPTCKQPFGTYYNPFMNDSHADQLNFSPSGRSGLVNIIGGGLNTPSDPRKNSAMWMYKSAQADEFIDANWSGETSGFYPVSQDQKEYGMFGDLYVPANQDRPTLKDLDSIKNLVMVDGKDGRYGTRYVTEQDIEHTYLQVLTNCGEKIPDVDLVFGRDWWNEWGRTLAIGPIVMGLVAVWRTGLVLLDFIGVFGADDRAIARRDFQVQYGRNGDRGLLQAIKKIWLGTMGQFISSQRIIDRETNADNAEADQAADDRAVNVGVRTGAAINAAISTDGTRLITLTQQNDEYRRQISELTTQLGESALRLSVSSDDSSDEDSPPFTPPRDLVVGGPRPIQPSPGWLTRRFQEISEVFQNNGRPLCIAPDAGGNRPPGQNHWYDDNPNGLGQVRRLRDCPIESSSRPQEGLSDPKNIIRINGPSGLLLDFSMNDIGGFMDPYLIESFGDTYSMEDPTYLEKINIMMNNNPNNNFSPLILIGSITSTDPSNIDSIFFYIIKKLWFKGWVNQDYTSWYNKYALLISYLKQFISNIFLHSNTPEFTKIREMFNRQSQAIALVEHTGNISLDIMFSLYLVTFINKYNIRNNIRTTNNECSVLPFSQIDISDFNIGMQGTYSDNPLYNLYMYIFIYSCYKDCSVISTDPYAINIEYAGRPQSSNIFNSGVGHPAPANYASIISFSYSLNHLLEWLFIPIFNNSSKYKKISVYNFNTQKISNEHNSSSFNNFVAYNYNIFTSTLDIGVLPDILYLSELLISTNMTYEILAEKYYI